MNSENKGYTLAVENGRLQRKQEKIFLKPMVLYIPQQAVEAVNGLLSDLPDDNLEGEFVLTVTNNNNGVSVDKSFSSLAALRDPLTAADAVKELINIVRGYESDEETNVCGWSGRYPAAGWPLSPEAICPTSHSRSAIISPRCAAASVVTR